MSDELGSWLRSRISVRRPSAASLDRTLVAALIAMFCVGVLVEGGTLHRGVILRIGLIVAAIAPFGWRRTHPLAAFAVTLGVVAFDVVGIRNELLMPVLFFALYSIARHGNQGSSGIGLAGTGVLVLVAQMLAAEPLGAAIISTVLTVIPWLLGERGRLSANRRLELYQHIDNLEFDRNRRAREAVTEERLRFARELHDVVSHSIAAVALHAGGARTSDLEMEPEVREQFATIERTARRELGEIRQLLHALRSAGDPADIGPSVHLCDLTELAQRHTMDNLEVVVNYSGDVRVLSHNVELAGYRIIHEALFNARRHGDADRATVSVSFAPAELSIVVLDNGQIGKKSPDGLGLAGMRERADMLGGSFNAGPTEEGWKVQAAIPLRRD